MNRILSLVRRCVEDYEMIAPNDRVAVGVSGGKDSLMLLTALAKLREFYPIPFEVEAITLDMGHADGRFNGHDSGYDIYESVQKGNEDEDDRRR